MDKSDERAGAARRFDCKDCRGARMFASGMLDTGQQNVVAVRDACQEGICLAARQNYRTTIYAENG